MRKEDGNLSQKHRDAKMQEQKRNLDRSGEPKSLVSKVAKLDPKESRFYESGIELLARVLKERRTKWESVQLSKFKARGGSPNDEKWKNSYKEPIAPETGKLLSLPEGWAWATVQQLGETTTGFTPPKENPNFFGGDIPFFKPTDLDAGYNVREFRDSLSKAGAAQGRCVPELSVLVTCIGATIGKTGLARVPCATNQQINSLTVNPELVSPEFLFWFFTGPLGQRQILANASATTLPILNKSRFEALVVPVPSLAEQHGIVSEIEKQFTRLEAGVASLKRVQAALKRYRASVLKAACEGRLVPTEAELAHLDGRSYETGEQLLSRVLKERRDRWEAAQLAKFDATGESPKDNKWKMRYKEPGVRRNLNLPTLPEGWFWAPVETISTKVADGVHKKPSYVASGIPFVTVRNLTAGPGISFDKLNFVSEEDHRVFINRADPQRGDILISKDGTLGVVRVIECDTIFSIFVSVALIKPVMREMSRYLGVALRSPQVQAQMVPKGSGLQHIHLEDLREDCVPLPPFAEQQRIAAEVERRFSVLDKLEMAISANLKRADRLRQSILYNAFTGKL
jgi:type I restriction enzyme, S subunit